MPRPELAIQRVEPLRTKIARPARGPNVIGRVAVEEVLDRGARVTAVVGAAGFGKTSAVVAWASRLTEPVAWYSVDAYDDRPTVFWRHLTEAIGQVHPDAGTEAAAEAGADGDDAGRWPSSDPEPVRLLAAMGPDPATTVVVIDDLHLVEHSAILEQLAYFVERAPAALRFVLIARVHPPLPWGRWAIRELLAEVPERLLLMDRAEATALVRQGAAAGVTEGAVDRVVAAAAGWPAALRLAGLTLGEADPADGGVAAAYEANGHAASALRRDRHFFDFVAGEVLDHLPAELRNTAALLSLLDDLDPRRCELLCDAADGRAVLDDLARRGLPMVALDPDAHGYRFHALFREVLAAELARTKGDEMHALHARAASVELTVGNEPAAVRHLIAAGDLDAAFSIVFTPVAELYRNGSMRQMAEWIDRFPIDFVAGSAARSAAIALAMTYLGRRDEAEQWNQMASALDPGPSPVTDSAMTLPRVLLALDRGDTEAVRGEVAALQARHSEDDFDLDAGRQLHSAMAIAALVDERLDDAAHWVAAIVRRPDAPERARLVGQPTRAAWEAFLRGALDQAAALARSALDAGGDTGRAAEHAAVELYSLQAALALEQLDLEQAASWAGRAADRVDRMPPCLHRFIADRAVVAVHEARSGIEPALRALRAAAHGAPPTLAARYELMAADLEARAGSGKAAAQRLAALAPSPRRTLLFARVAALAGRSELVLAHLDSLGALPKALEIEAALLRARAATGFAEVTQAVAAGADAGYVWTYRREGPEVDGLLREVLTAEPRWRETPLAASLRAGDERSPGTVAVLSETEQRVLAHLPSHHSLAEIASQMHLSVNTVKSHVRSIYTKLGAGKRGAAVRRAEELGLLR